MTHPGDRPNDDRSQRAQLALARLLPKLFRGGQAFVGVEASLSGLDAQTATRVPDRLPHSVLDLLAHINWWNRWMLDTIEMGQAQPYPAHAADTAHARRGRLGPHKERILRTAGPHRRPCRAP